MPRSLSLLFAPALLLSALLSGACATADTSFDDDTLGAGGSIGDEGGAAGDEGQAGTDDFGGAAGTTGGKAGSAGKAGGGGAGSGGTAGGGGAGQAGQAGQGGAGQAGAAGSTGGAGQGGAKGLCCSAHDSPGCANAAVEACVCAEDASCCQGDWNAFCVTQVTKLDCGVCSGGPGGAAGASGSGGKAGSAGTAGTGGAGGEEPFGGGGAGQAGAGQSGAAGSGQAGTGNNTCSALGEDACYDCCGDAHPTGLDAYNADVEACACGGCVLLCGGFCAFGGTPGALCVECLNLSLNTPDCPFTQCANTPDCVAMNQCDSTCQ
jgi:hypothetical protein